MNAIAQPLATVDEWPELSRMEQLELLQWGLSQALVGGDDERAAVIAGWIRTLHQDINDAFATSLFNATAGLWQLH